MRLCSVCRAPSAYKCSGCQAFYYCSHECQVQGWKGHKMVCKYAKGDSVLKKLHAPKLKCAVCKEISFGLTRLPCCGSSIHDKCYSGCECPICGKWCGFGLQSNKTREFMTYPTSLVERIRKSVETVLVIMKQRGLSNEEMEGFNTVINGFGFVFQAHYNGKKSGQEEDAFILRIMEKPNAISRSIVLTRIMMKKLDAVEPFPHQFAKGMADTMVMGLKRGEDKSVFHPSFLINSLKWFNGLIIYLPPTNVVLKTPELCFKAFVFACIHDEGRKFLDLIENSPSAVECVAAEMTKVDPEIQEVLLLKVLEYKMKNVANNFAQTFKK